MHSETLGQCFVASLHKTYVTLHEKYSQWNIFVILSAGNMNSRAAKRGDFKRGASQSGPVRPNLSFFVPFGKIGGSVWEYHTCRALYMQICYFHGIIFRSFVSLSHMPKVSQNYLWSGYRILRHNSKIVCVVFLCTWMVVDFLLLSVCLLAPRRLTLSAWQSEEVAVLGSCRSCLSLTHANKPGSGWWCELHGCVASVEGEREQPNVFMSMKCL